MFFQALEQQAGASDDFQEIGNEEKEVIKRKCSMDDVLEDKICGLYDLFVEVLSCLWIYPLGYLHRSSKSYLQFTLFWFQGLDEDAGPQVRKLYAEVYAFFLLCWE